MEVEHLLSESAETALRSVLVGAASAGTGSGSGSGSGSGRPVLLAAIEPEDHRLSLVALAAALTEASIATLLVGPRLPARALLDAVLRAGPFAVVLWAVRPAGSTAPGPMIAFRGLTALRPRPALILAGPGWDGTPAAEAGPGITMATDLAGAVAAVFAAASGGELTAPAR